MKTGVWPQWSARRTSLNASTQRDRYEKNRWNSDAAAAAAGGGGGTPATTAPEPVDCTTAAIGSDATYARADHVHVGTEQWQATTKAALTGVTNGAVGYATTTHLPYLGVNSAWVPAGITHTATTKAGLPTTDIENGERGYSTDDDKLYARVGGAWICLSHAEA